MKKKFISIITLFITYSVFCQSIERQVIGSVGQNLTDGNTMMSFTLGEVATTTVTDDVITFKQGFHQGQLLLSIKVNPIVFLQGAAINPNTGEETLMRDDLRIADLIPTTSPYSDGLVADASVFTAVGTDAILDWIWVELRDKNDDSIIIDSQSALLQRDGDVVAVDGVSPIGFNQPEGDYFVSVNHRNHLGIMSASAITLNNTSSVIDFTSSNTSVQGATNALILLSNGKYASYSGDYNEDALIQNNDVQAVVPLIGNSGYDNADMDENTLIQNTDLNNLIIPNIGRAQQFSRTSNQNQANLDATPDIHLTFANAQITSEGANNYYEVDVLIESTVDFKVGSGQFYLNYNIAAFGPNVSANGKIVYLQPANSILGETYGFPAYKDFIQNDTYEATVSLSFQQGVSSGTITDNNVTSTPKVLCHIKMTYLDSTQDPEICFEYQSIYIHQFYTACGPSTVGFPDCFNEPGEQLFNDTFDCAGADLGTLDIAETEDLNIMLFPNPTKGAFYVKGLRDTATIVIHDMTGKVVMSQQTINSDEAISVDKLSSGLYLVAIKTNNGSIIKKLVIQ